MQINYYPNLAHRPRGAHLGQPARRQVRCADSTPQDLRQLHVHYELHPCDAPHSVGRERAQRSTGSCRRSRESARGGLLRRDYLRSRA